MIDGRKLRDTFKYHVVVGHKTVHRGITMDLSRREAELQRTWPGSHIRQIGRKTTREQALRWERVGARRSYLRTEGKAANLIARLWRWAWAG